MRTSIRLATLLIVGASPLLAQGPGAPDGPPPMGGMGPGRGGAGRGAAFLLSHTGDLELTDAQVVKLAAIARRGAVRLRGMRARMDSAGVGARGPRGPGRAARGRIAEHTPFPLPRASPARPRRRGARAARRSACAGGGPGGPRGVGARADPGPRPSPSG